MTKYFVKYLLIGLLFCAFSGTVLAQNSLVGKWLLVDEDDTSYMIFDTEGYITINYKDGFTGEYTTVGGKNFNVDSLSYDLRYSIDTGKKPAQIEISFYLAGTDMLLSFMPGIAQFENNKTLKLNLYEDNRMDYRAPLSPQEISKVRALRPKTFDTQTQILSRIK